MGPMRTDENRWKSLKRRTTKQDLFFLEALLRSIERLLAFQERSKNAVGNARIWKKRKHAELGGAFIFFYFQPPKGEDNFPVDKYF